MRSENPEMKKGKDSGDHYANEAKDNVVLSGLFYSDCYVLHNCTLVAHVTGGLWHPSELR